MEAFHVIHNHLKIEYGIRKQDPYFDIYFRKRAANIQ